MLIGEKKWYNKVLVEVCERHFKYYRDALLRGIQIQKRCTRDITSYYTQGRIRSKMKPLLDDDDLYL